MIVRVSIAMRALMLATLLLALPTLPVTAHTRSLQRIPHRAAPAAYPAPRPGALAGWHWLTYGGTPAVPGYRLGVPPRWAVRLWPDTAAGYGQLDLRSPAGRLVQLAILPLGAGMPAASALLALDRAALFRPLQDSIVLPAGQALRLSGLALPAAADRTGVMIYLRRGVLVYRFASFGPAGSDVNALLLQIAATLSPLNGTARTVIPPPPPPVPPVETCCHCPAWGIGWGQVLTRIDGIPVYWNAGDTDNGCVGRYGYLYQCVELAQRYFALRWGYPPIWAGVAAAADMRYNHPPGITFIPNGSAPGPREGDALIFYGGGFGHVALVQNVDRVHGQLALVEENWSPTGQATLALYGTTTVGFRDSAYGTYMVAGWLHSALNG